MFRYRLRTLLIVLAILPPVVGLTYHLATGWPFTAIVRMVPENSQLRTPIAGGSQFSISTDGSVIDE